MKGPLLILIFLMCSSWCRGQSEVGKLPMDQSDISKSLPPGTIQIEVSPLALDWVDGSCKQDWPQMGVKVLRIISSGSGLINPFEAGDSIRVRVLSSFDFSQISIQEGDTLLLKEELCTFQDTYYLLFRK